VIEHDVRRLHRLVSDIITAYAKSDEQRAPSGEGQQRRFDRERRE
jgi:phosphate starvation-inducible PhoH-like protein